MGGGEGVASAVRSREAAISWTRVNQHSRIYIIFSRVKRGGGERGGVVRDADKNTFVISLMVVPFYRFSVRHTPPQLDYFGGVRLIALRPSYVSWIIVEGWGTLSLSFS